MLRITQVDTESLEGPVTRLRVEGTISGESVAALLDACGVLLNASASGSVDVALDVAGVRFVDAPGAAALRELTSRGVRLTGLSPLVRGLLHLEARDELSA